MREYYWYLFAMCYPIGMFPVWLCYLLPTARRWPKVTFCLIPTVGAVIAIVTVELMCWAYDSEQQAIEVGRGGYALRMAEAKSQPPFCTHFLGVY